jgi:hypothetical protein
MAPSTPPNQTGWTSVTAVLARAGESGPALVWCGFGLGLAAAVCVGLHHSLWGLAPFLLSQLLFAVAELRPQLTYIENQTRYLKQILQPIALAALPFAFALADPARALSATFFLCALVAYQCALLAQGLSWPHAKRANIVFSIASLLGFVFACALPDRFSVVAYVLGVLGFVAAGLSLASGLAEQ